MKDLDIKSNPEVAVVIGGYPKDVQTKILILRELIIETAKEIEDLKTLEETLKWGEPSYLTKNGSTLRMAWKSKVPNYYAMYFKCTSRLVETFRLTFENKFNFEGNRAIVFKMDDKIPEDELKQCIKATLCYHKVKYLPTLGIEHEKDNI